MTYSNSPGGKEFEGVPGSLPASRLGAPSAPMRIVACGDCPGHCCKNDMIVLHPELGDDVSSYQTVEIVHPLYGHAAVMLDHKPNGDCIYLGEAGCTIHGRHPAICREYDCGDQYAKLTRAERRSFIARHLFSRAQLEQGRRVHTARLAMAGSSAKAPDASQAESLNQSLLKANPEGAGG